MATNAAAVSRKLHALGYDLHRAAGIRIKEGYSALHVGDVYIGMSGTYLRSLPRGIDGLVADLEGNGLTVLKVKYAPADPTCETYGPTLYIAKKTEN